MRIATRRPVTLLDDLERALVLVVGAHPDDEVIGAGALLSHVRGAGVITVTSGAPRRHRDKGTVAAYARERQWEAVAALSLLHRDIVPCVNFGIPDQEAIYYVATIVRRLMPLLQESDFEYVITHPYEGGHPDHDATALAVRSASMLLEEAGYKAPIIIEMTSYHERGGQEVFGEFLPHADAGAARTFVLGERDRDLKHRMFACHISQAQVLRNFPLDVERFRVAPRYDFLKPPHAGRLGYQSLIWGFDGQVWCRAAARALHRLHLLEG